MILSSFVELLESPALARLIVILLVSLPFFFLQRKDTVGQFRGYLLIATLFFLKETVSLFFRPDFFMPFAEILIAGVISLVFLLPGRRFRFLLPVLLVFDLVFLAWLILVNFIPALDLLPFWMFSIVACVQIILVSLLVIKPLQTPDNVSSQIPEKVWHWLLACWLAYTLASIYPGRESALFAWLISPLSYLWILLAAFAAQRLLDSELISAVAYYEDSLDSIYNLFLSSGSALDQNFITEDILKNMSETMLAETSASGSVIFLADDLDESIVCRAYTGLFPPPVPLPESLPRKANRVELFMKHIQFGMGESIFGEVARTGKQVYVPDALNDPLIHQNGEEDFLRISSIMILPLAIENRNIGVVSVVKTKPGDQFTEEDFDKFKLLANFGSLAVSNFFTFLEANERSGLQQSADIAAEIQRSIMPKKLPQFPRLSLGAFSIPAIGVSGDYYDVMQTRKNRLVCAVGDVAGKGVPAALIMVMIRAILHLITNTDQDIATVLNWVNRGITGQVDIDHYATLVVVSINLETGEVEYSIANHQPLVLYRKANDDVEFLEIKGVPIGVERGSSYKRAQLQLQKGDILLMYTDGVIEALNESGRQYGQKNLAAALKKYRDLEPREIVARIKSDLGIYSGSVRQHDDQTILAMKFQ